MGLGAFFRNNQKFEDKHFRIRSVKNSKNKSTPWIEIDSSFIKSLKKLNVLLIIVVEFFAREDKRFGEL